MWGPARHLPSFAVRNSGEIGDRRHARGSDRRARRRREIGRRDKAVAHAASAAGVWTLTPAGPEAGAGEATPSPSSSPAPASVGSAPPHHRTRRWRRGIGLRERRGDPAPDAPFLDPVVQQHPEDDQDTAGDEAELQRRHAVMMPVSAICSASEMSTATTRETPGSGIVMPMS
jgi:hypothetical protein